MKKNKAFTFIELLVVIAILSLLAISIFIFINPIKQIDKSLDTKRKTDLSGLKRVLEDWYNDHNYYPLDTDICFDPPFDTNKGCHICGKTTTPPNFLPYLPELPCDPKNTGSNIYYYQVDDGLKPSWFRIYTQLINKDDRGISESNCTSGCGPAGSSYNYGVSSPNIDLEIQPTPIAQPTCPVTSWCYQNSKNPCQRCGSVATCTANCASPLKIYGVGDCSKTCKP